MKRVSIQISRKVKGVFIILLFQSLFLEMVHLSVFPVISFPKFRGDEFQKDKESNKIESTNYKTLLKKIYPHDKRYFLFIQRAMEDSTNVDEIQQFLSKKR